MLKQAIFILALISTTNAFMLRPSKDIYKQSIIEKIRAEVKLPLGTHHHKAYDNLAYFVDTIGPRMWGSEAMAEAVEALNDQIKAIGFDKSGKENLGPFKSWRRGAESLTLKEPREFPTKLSLIGLGLGASGDAEGEVIVVHSFEELIQQKDQIPGKIVLYHFEWSSYGADIQFRSVGPIKAQQYGAIGALIRSVASFSIDSPHTGVTTFKDLTIPSAAISVEDSEMMDRMQKRGQKIVVELHIESEWYDTTSDNVIAEITGSQYPDQIVLMGGHWDSWDTGSQTGANDDGGGVMVCLEALKVLKNIGVKPKRTIRFIAWSGEEMGRPERGAEHYAKTHGQEKHIIAFESDTGTTKPYGFGITAGVRATQQIVYLAQQYLTGVGAERVFPNAGGSADSGSLQNYYGTPLMNNKIEDNSSRDFYFTYHHSAGDAMTMMDADDLDDNVVAIASLMYIIADMEETLPSD